MFPKSQILSALIIILISNISIAQTSIDLFGYINNPSNRHFGLESPESNPVHSSGLQDWEISMVLTNLIAEDNMSGTISQLAIGKAIGNHIFYARYTPGIYHNFEFSTGTNILVQNSFEVETELKTRLEYYERFGLGYTYVLNDVISVGITGRYFSQKIIEDTPILDFGDSSNYIFTETITTTNNYWRGDIGFTFSPTKNSNFSICSENLIIADEDLLSEDQKPYAMRKEKAITFGAEFLPMQGIKILGKYQTYGSYLLGGQGYFPLFNGMISAGIHAFHDRFQSPFVTGIAPAIQYANDLFSITLSGVTYFRDQTDSKPLTEFLENGIHNIMNNAYSHNQVRLATNIALSFVNEQKIKFLDVQILHDLYPTLSEKYVNEPFALAKVINLTDETISITPSCHIPNVNDDLIQSPKIALSPRDTIEVPYYTIFQDTKKNIKQRVISRADFYVSAKTDNIDDQLQKPILINDANSWDGRVINLRYFIEAGLQFGSEYSKSILQKHKTEIENIPYDIKTFARIKLLFNHFAEHMIYASDPRASTEKVQFPNETISIKGGDCDDLSVCFSAMLEGIGIRTALVDYKETESIRHVNLLVNTGLTPDKAGLITINDKKYIIRTNETGKDEVWIAVETTSLTNFETAWEEGTTLFNKEALDNYGLVKGSVEIIDIY